MRNFGPKSLVVLMFGMGICAFAGWLLLADVEIGQAAPARKARSSAPQKAKAVISVARVHGGYGYGGSSAGCRVPDVLPWPSDRIPSKGRYALVGTDADLVPGGNADGSTEAFLVDAQGRTVTQLTSDQMRCQDGSRHNQPCMVSRDCPGGFCADTSVGDHGIANKGKKITVYFVYDGNPLGTNADLGDELWMWTPGKKKKPPTLVQLTTMSGWCSDEVTRGCTVDADCSNGSCILAAIGGLQVGEGPNDPVVFATSGNPGEVGGNEAHADAVYSLAGKKKKRQLGLVSSGGRICGKASQNAGQPCTKDEDCGVVCGNGMIEAGEQCDGTNKGCAANQFCLPAGSQGQCTCGTPTCGDGLVDSPFEECDSAPSFASCLSCKADCTCVVCGDGTVESPEQCDPSASPTGCAAGATCATSSSDNPCTCVTPVCGNGEVESGEECDGYVNSFGSCIACKGDCTCVTCGDGVTEAPEQCDIGTSPTGCPAGQSCDSLCRCVAS